MKKFFFATILLFLGLGQVWADTELVNINLSSWSTQSISAGGSVSGYYFKSASTITNGSGWVKTSNASNTANYIGIPLSGVNGSVTITVTHYSCRPTMGYELVTGNSAFNANYSHSNSMSSTRIGTNGTTTTITINGLSGSYGHLILGATGNATNSTFYISRIVVTTPANANKRIYMKAGEWNNDSPYFYAHSWGSSNSDVLMALASCETDVYYADIPSGNTSVLFTRQETNSGIKYKDESGNWNQSADITISTNDKFTFSAWNGGDGKSTFTGGTYSAPTYTISYNNGGGSGSMSSQSSIACGTDKVTSSNTFTRLGYTFAGWKANVDVKVGGSTKTAGTVLADGVTIQDITGNITLTAQWDEVECPESGSLYSAATSATGDISIASGASNLTLTTATHKTTVTGGSMSVYNGQGSAKNLITASGYSMTNNNTYFRIDLDCPLQEGDTISVSVGKDGSNEKGVWISTATSRPGSAPACALTATNASLVPVTYIVTGSDAYHGNSTFYIYRATANTTYFNNISITRPEACSTPAAPTNFTAGSITATGVTFSITDAADAASYDIYYSTSSSAPGGSTTATTTSTSKTKAITGLMAATQYYAWVRSVCDESNKSAWVALNPAGSTHTFTTSCVAPTSVTIEASSYYFSAGDEVTFTSTVTGGAGTPVSYQWKKNGENIAGATSDSYTIASAVVGDAGSYSLTVTKGECSTTSEAYKLKCFRMLLKESRNGSDIAFYPLVMSDASHGSVSVSLTGGRNYGFGLSNGIGYYGNTGTMTSANCTNWTLNDAGSCEITTNSKSATYTFNFDFSAGDEGSAKVSVVYPGANQAADKIIYWDNNVLEWASAPWYRIGKNGHNNKTQMTLVPGTANLYKVTTSTYDGFEYWHIANNEGEGTGNVFWTKDSDPTTDEAITAAMGFEGSPVTASAVTVTPGTDHSTGGSSDNNNCEFYSYTITSGMKTDRVTISSYSNGTITVNYTDTEDEEQSFTSGYQDLAHTVILTSITAVPATGYTIDDPLTIDGETYAANHVVTDATTIAASFKPATYTVTLNTNSGTINAGNVTSYTYLTGATLPTNVTRDGYRFVGWYAASDFSGDRVYTIGTSEYGNKEYWAKWAQLYTITNGSPSNGTITVVSSAIAGETVDITATANTGYDFSAWNIYKTGIPATTITPAAATETTSFTMPAYGVTVDASFVVKTYSLSYAIGTGATGAASGGTAAGSYAAGTTITVPAQGTLAKEGYTFCGWSDGTTFYTSGQSFSMPAGAVTLTTVWDPGDPDPAALVSIDFTDETASTSYTAGETYTIDGTSVYFKSAMSIYSSGGYLVTSSNAKTSSNYIAVPLANINGEITITVTHNSTRPQWKYYFAGLDAAATSSNLSTTPSSLTESTRSGSNTTTSSWTISTNKSYGVFYIGRGSNGTDQFKKLTISTPGTDTHFDVTFADQTGFGGTSSLPGTIYGVKSGLKILAPSDPTATGYTFGGWYTDATCETEVNWGTMTITEDKTIYAKWTANTTTVTINANTGNHGSTAPSAFTATYGHALPEFTAATGESGWALTGYYDAATGGKKVIDADGTFSSNSGIWNRTDGATLTLYAQYELAIYTITYNANGGSCATSSATQASVGAELTLPTPTWSGYTFDGWYSAGSKIGDAGDSYAPTADITLYAHWTDDISGKLFSYVDGNYGDKCKKFDGSEWVTANETNINKTFTNATTNVQFVVTKGAVDYKSTGIISSFAKYLGTSDESTRTGMSVVIPTGYIATVKILYGAYNTGNDYKLTVNGTAQTAPAASMTDAMTSVSGIMTEVTLENQTGTLVLSIAKTNGKNLYIARVSATITGYQTLTFVGSSGSNWNTTDNWSPECVPTIEHDVVIEAPVEVNIDHAVAKSVIIYNDDDTKTGKLTIQANKGLEVAGTISLTTDGSNSLATRTSDLILESSSAGNATLIFDNSNSCQATVQMYSKGWTTGTQGSGTWNWQFVGVPVSDATRLNDYYDGYMYEWDNGWVDKTDFNAPLTPFTAYSVTYPTEENDLHTYEIDGTLVATTSKTIDIAAGTTVQAAANSWTAPIRINDITSTNWSPANIFLYNTGYNPDEDHKADEAGTRYVAGSYLCIPVSSAPYTGDSLIAPMQGFLFKNTKSVSKGTITLSYADAVRTDGSQNIVAGAMHAPARSNKEEVIAPVVMKIYVSDSEHDDRVVLLERSDFSRGFDNGWDGEKFQVNAVKTAPRLFAINETGGKEAVSAIPEIEGTVIGFRPGTEANYTLSFEFSGAQTFYLYDTNTGFTTLIDSESEYSFTSNGANEDARFVISRAPATATGMEQLSGNPATSNVRKVIIDDLLYIERAGQLYTIEGTPVK